MTKHGSLELQLKPIDVDEFEDVFHRAQGRFAP